MPEIKQTIPCIAIVGLGNELMADDGVGVHAVRRLAARAPEGVRVVEVGTAILHALDVLENADVVIALDAVRFGGAPGAICRFEGKDLRQAFESGFSLHDLGIAGALRMIDPERRPTVIVLGVEPARIDLETELTPAVAAALPRLVEAALDVAAELREAAPSAAARTRSAP